MEARPTDNLDAYDYYLRGLEYFQETSGGTDERALRLAKQLYEQAVSADSNFAEAWASLSQVYTETYWHADKDEEILARSRFCMDRAQELDPELPEVHVARGSYYYHEDDYDGALK